MTYRFINRDSQLNIDSFNGYNTFAYCNNNPIVFIDPNGKDAILLLDINLQGHLGALVEDENGDWWHFYWGTTTEHFEDAIKGKNVPVYTWCELCTGKLNLDSINNSGQYGGTYSYGYYMAADFSSCVDTFKEPLDSSYNLYSRNCAQVTTSILASASTPHEPYLREASKKLLPIKAFTTTVDYTPTFEFTTDYKRITLKERLYH